MGKPPKTNGEAYIATIKRIVKPFFDRHPAATIEMLGSAALIDGLWSDDSISLYVPRSSPRKEELVEALNNLIFPDRLSAIYHVDSHILEVIWTAYELPEHLAEVVGREFVFKYNGCDHNCRFGPSTERLLAIGREVIFRGFSDTGYRNLKSFEALQNPQDQSVDEDIPESSKELSDPVSFYIDNIDDPCGDDIIKFLQHLNFYLKYFDSRSPAVKIHEIEPIAKYADRSRYVDKVFPGKISAQPLNQNLISFWLGAADGDASRRFLNYFRIIEYVSFYYVDASARAKIARIMANPNASTDIFNITDQAIEVLKDAKGDDYAKFKSTVTDLVKERHVVREVMLNVEYFSKEIEFDGGFKLKPFIVSNKPPSIGPNGMDSFVTIIRDIRNALSHGRDQKTGQVILPTTRNLSELQPWVELIATAAAEVVLYEGVH